MKLGEDLLFKLQPHRHVRAVEVLKRSVSGLRAISYVLGSLNGESTIKIISKINVDSNNHCTIKAYLELNLLDGMTSSLRRKSLVRLIEAKLIIAKNRNRIGVVRLQWGSSIHGLEFNLHLKIN